MTKIALTHLGVNLKVRDFDASRAFYDAFGFRRLFAFGPESDEQSPFRGQFYQVGDTLFEISEGHMAVKPEVFAAPVPDSKVSLMVYVESLVPVLETCERHAVEIHVAPRLFPWGQIGVVVKDPDGFVVVFLSEDSEQERERVQARTTAPLIRAEPDYTDDHLRAVRSRRAGGS